MLGIYCDWRCKLHEKPEMMAVGRKVLSLCNAECSILSEPCIKAAAQPAFRVRVPVERKGVPSLTTRSRSFSSLTY